MRQPNERRPRLVEAARPPIEPADGDTRPSDGACVPGKSDQGIYCRRRCAGRCRSRRGPAGCVCGFGRLCRHRPQDPHVRAAHRATSGRVLCRGASPRTPHRRGSPVRADRWRRRAGARQVSQRRARVERRGQPPFPLRRFGHRPRAGSSPQRYRSRRQGSACTTGKRSASRRRRSRPPPESYPSRPVMPAGHAHSRARIRRRWPSTFRSRSPRANQTFKPFIVP